VAPIAYEEQKEGVGSENDEDSFVSFEVEEQGNQMPSFEEDNFNQ